MVARAWIILIAVIALGVGCGNYVNYLMSSQSSILPGSVSIVLVMIGAIFFDIWRKEPTPNHTIKSLVSHYFIYRILRIVSKLIRMRFNRMCKSCKKTQASVLTDILNVNRKTRFFKDHGVDKLQTVEEFRQNVSLTTFTEYKTYVESIKQRGEENVLFPGPTQFLAVTSGTTSGKSKFIAKNMKKFGSIMIYVAAIYDTMYKIPGMKNLRRQLLATTKAKSFNSESGIQCGSISLISYGKTHFPFYATPNLDITTEKESMYVHLLYGLSDRFINMISAPVATNLLTLMEVLENKWESLCEDIERGSLSEAINISTNDRNIINTTLERRPDRAEELRKIFNNGFQDIVPKVWPHCLCATASKTGVFATAAQIIEERYLGGVPLNTWLHISTEAISGIVMELCPDEVHYVLAIPCCFFEFLPQSEVDSERPRLLMAHQVNVGETYEMVITTYDGLCRYRTEDMVEIVGFYGETPKYKFVRRAGDMLSANLEKVPEAILRESVYACAERGEWKRNIVEFITSESIHVQNPSGLKLDTKHYIVFIELDNEAILEETMKTDIDQELCFRHEVYSAMRENRKLEPIELVQIRHGTFSLVKRYILSTNSDAFSAHVKMPRVLRRKDIIDILMENVL